MLALTRRVVFVADPSTYRPAPGAIPDSPGVYRFRDAKGRVIYVGKAKSLRSRVSSYFQDIANLHERTAIMAFMASDVDETGDDQGRFAHSGRAT